MAIFTCTFTQDLNVNVAVGDTLYVSQQSSGNSNTFSTSAGFSVATSFTEIGVITAINRTTRVITVGESALSSNPVDADPGAFLFFSKNNAGSMSSLLGYYAEVKMRLQGAISEDCELYQVSTDIFESSK
tara:strand:+ start:308 stop:697 length:390 start_codon:yes stop_codon:yes gene_type:complete